MKCGQFSCLTLPLHFSCGSRLSNGDQFNSQLATLVLSCTASEIGRLKGRKSPIRTYPTLIINALARGDPFRTDPSRATAGPGKPLARGSNRPITTSFRRRPYRDNEGVVREGTSGGVSPHHATRDLGERISSPSRIRPKMGFMPI